jgi:ubiquinone/menaquinone biosynthesis C-methylase UbiE
MRNLFAERIKELNPKTALDVGCGCGEFTAEIAAYSEHITAIDASEALITRCKKEKQKPNVEYIRMDGRKLDFPDNHFNLVYERSSLHHILDWKKALDEMIRATKKYVFIAENHDDPRSKEKQNTIYFNKVFLELQHEAKYEHYPHLKPVAIENFLHQNDIKFESYISRHEESIPFKEYADVYETFAAKTTRKKYWMDKLEEIRRDINNENLCEHDMLYIFGEKE